MRQSDDSKYSDPQPPSVASTFDGQRSQMMLADLTRRMRGGAANFFWIAGLSVVNSVLAFTGSDTRFVIGLAVTQFVDALASIISKDVPEASTILTIIAVVIDLVVVGIFAFFGYFARTGRRWAFIIGMMLYAFDALVMLVFQDWLAFGFHLFFLFGLFNGLRALNQLQRIATPKSISDFPQNIGTL